jgi:hypothetical protein
MSKTIRISDICSDTITRDATNAGQRFAASCCNNGQHLSAAVACDGACWMLTMLSESRDHACRSLRHIAGRKHIVIRRNERGTLGATPCVGTPGLFPARRGISRDSSCPLQPAADRSAIDPVSTHRVRRKEPLGAEYALLVATSRPDAMSKLPPSRRSCD